MVKVGGGVKISSPMIQGLEWRSAESGLEGSGVTVEVGVQWGVAEWSGRGVGGCSEG